jgi:hypothetical protein
MAFWLGGSLDPFAISYGEKRDTLQRAEKILNDRVQGPITTAAEACRAR